MLDSLTGALVGSGVLVALGRGVLVGSGVAVGSGVLVGVGVVGSGVCVGTALVKVGSVRNKLPDRIVSAPGLAFASLLLLPSREAINASIIMTTPYASAVSHFMLIPHAWIVFASL